MALPVTVVTNGLMGTRLTSNEYTVSIYSGSISYNVAVRGCHEVVVLVDGQEVPGSPFPFCLPLSY